MPGAGSTLPAFVTHYHRPDRRPFQNLSDLTDEALRKALGELEGEQGREGSRRRFGPRYMSLRRATEARARELFSSLGGRPERSSPHYFVLGESAWFAGLYDGVAQVRLPLAQLPAEVTSVTGTDSISALGLGQQLGVPLPADRRRCRLYRLDQLEVDAVHEWLAGDAEGYDGYQFRPLENYVEVQLWSDRPVAAFLTPPVAEPPLSPGE